VSTKGSVRDMFAVGQSEMLSWGEPVLLLGRCKCAETQVPAGKDDGRPADYHEQSLQFTHRIPGDESEAVVSNCTTCQAGHIF